MGGGKPYYERGGAAIMGEKLICNTGHTRHVILAAIGHVMIEVMSKMGICHNKEKTKR